MRWTLQQIDSTASVTTITLTTIKDIMEDVAPQSLRWAWFFISEQTWAFQTVTKPRHLTFLFEVPQLGVIFNPEQHCHNKKYINYENNSINNENTFEGIKQADSAKCRRWNGFNLVKKTAARNTVRGDQPPKKQTFRASYRWRAHNCVYSGKSSLYPFIWWFCV